MSGVTDLDQDTPAPAPEVFHGQPPPRLRRDGLEAMEGPNVSFSAAERLRDLAERRPTLVVATAAVTGWLLGVWGSRRRR